MLADIAKNDSHGFVQKVAVREVDDQALLAVLAKNGADAGVRKVADRKFGD